MIRDLMLKAQRRTQRVHRQPLRNFNPKVAPGLEIAVATINGSDLTVVYKPKK